MGLNPFSANDHIRERCERLAAEHGERLGAEILSAARSNLDPGENLGAILVAPEVERLIATYGLAGVEELMLLVQPAAQAFAQPPISSYLVGAVGLEGETGNLILGGNIEFPRSHLGFTIHGEGFVVARAFSRGTQVTAIALREAHPCAHCRQFLSEFAGSAELSLIDPRGHRLTLSQLYPWPFDPAYLGETGIVAGGSINHGLELPENNLSDEIALRLLDIGRRAYAPYSSCPGAVVLELMDGRTIAGASIESVAFNPTMGPLQAAWIDLLAHGYTALDVRHAFLGTVAGGAVDYESSVGELLASLAPEVPLTVVPWSGKSVGF